MPCDNFLQSTQNMFKQHHLIIVAATLRRWHCELLLGRGGVKHVCSEAPCMCAACFVSHIDFTSFRDIPELEVIRLRNGLSLINVDDVCRVFRKPLLPLDFMLLQLLHGIPKFSHPHLGYVDCQRPNKPEGAVQSERNQLRDSNLLAWGVHELVCNSLEHRSKLSPAPHSSSRWPSMASIGCIVCIAFLVRTGIWKSTCLDGRCFAAALKRTSSNATMRSAPSGTGTTTQDILYINHGNPV